MRLPFLATILLAAVLGGCGNPPDPEGPTQTACSFPPNQASNSLTMSCTVTGPLPNIRLDPFVPGDAPCGLASWSVFSQQVNAPMTVVYAPNGDENPGRVRIGVTLGASTHSGKIAKDNPADNCATVAGPQFDINTSFAGTHVAQVDKGKSPMCVFRSRLTLGTFNQTLTAGLPLDISGMTSAATRDALERRIDLEVALAVNRLLSPGSLPLSDAMVRRGGRCENDWEPFTGN